jgi:hypothetical protein
MERLVTSQFWENQPIANIKMQGTLKVVKLKEGPIADL